MYSIVRLHTTIRVEPDRLGDVHSAIVQSLRANYEDSIVDDRLILKIQSIEALDPHGAVDDATGSVNYDCDFVCATFRPVVGEDLDIEVEMASDVAVFGHPTLFHSKKVRCVSPKELWGRTASGTPLEKGSTVSMQIRSATIDTNYITIGGSINVGAQPL